MSLVNTSIYKTLKRSQWVYFMKIRLFDQDYRRAKREMRGALKSTEQIKREMKLVKAYWHCEPLHYIRYELFNKKLSDEELLDYIPPYYHYNFYTSNFYKNIDKQLYNNKLELFKLFRERMIPTPEVLACYQGGRLLDLQNHEISLDKLLVGFADNDKLFFKPANGQGGIGIVVSHVQNNRLYYQQQPFTMESIRKMLKDRQYILQKGLVQRSDISSINSSSVNTLRVITQWRNGKPFMGVAVMRIGRNGKEVDNSHQGGISVRVNIDNGQLYRAATAEHGGGIYLCHPDSGVVFENFKIEGWSDIKNTILSYVEKFPELEEIAWDVAITDNGVEIIELNLGYGLSHLQCCCGGMRRILNIYPQDIC